MKKTVHNGDIKISSTYTDSTFAQCQCVSAYVYYRLG